MENQNKITVYFKSSFGMGVVKVEGKYVGHGTRKYAQYDHSPYVDIIPKGKRKARRYMQTYNPYMLILEGVGHPSPDDTMEIVSNSPEVVVKQSKYLSFDERHETDFDSKIDKYILENNINIEDYRSTKGFSSSYGHSKEIN